MMIVNISLWLAAAALVVLTLVLPSAWCIWL